MKNRKELKNMEDIEFRKQREEFFRELDKGIRDMEQGNLLSCEEAIRQVREELGLYDV